MSAIAARDISMTFPTRSGAVQALDHVTVEVEDGHFVCIVGASGCGKSTLLNIMAGLIRPTSGTIEVRERAVTGPGADRGMVFQSYTLFPWLRVRENIEFGPSLNGVAADERRRIAESLLEEMGLAEFARALANNPDVLLMDEPFGALDALTRAGAQRFLTQIWEQHRRTIAFVTHDIDEAIYLGDKVYVMSPRPGRVKEIVQVDIARPRSLDDIGSQRFAELKRRILSLIFEDVDTEAAAAG